MHDGQTMNPQQMMNFQDGFARQLQMNDGQALAAGPNDDHFSKFQQQSLVHRQ